MIVTLYTTHCPKCEVLKKKLDNKKIEYDEIDDIKLIAKKGYLSVPVLEVDGTPFNFSTANNWVNQI